MRCSACGAVPADAAATACTFCRAPFLTEPATTERMTPAAAQPKPRSMKRLAILTAVVIGVIGVFVFAMALKPIESSFPHDPVAIHQGVDQVGESYASAPRAMVALTSDLAVIETSETPGVRGWNAGGKVQNNGTAVLRDVRVFVVMMDAAGREIGRESAPLGGDGLAPGAVASFIVPFPAVTAHPAATTYSAGIAP